MTKSASSATGRRLTSFLVQIIIPLSHNRFASIRSHCLRVFLAHLRPLEMLLDLGSMRILERVLAYSITESSSSIRLSAVCGLQTLSTKVLQQEPCLAAMTFVLQDSSHQARNAAIVVFGKIRNPAKCEPVVRKLIQQTLLRLETTESV